MAEPKNPALPKLRDWPIFRVAAGKRRKALDDGRAPPHISELIMGLVPGGPPEKLAWLRQQCAEGRLDGDDADEVAQAEALLAMLVRIGRSKEGEEKRHLDELLDEGLKETFPASDPVAVGHFTSIEPRADDRLRLGRVEAALQATRATQRGALSDAVRKAPSSVIDERRGGSAGHGMSDDG